MVKGILQASHHNSGSLSTNESSNSKSRNPNWFLFLFTRSKNHGVVSTVCARQNLNFSYLNKRGMKKTWFQHVNRCAALLFSPTSLSASLPSDSLLHYSLSTPLPHMNPPRMPLLECHTHCSPPLMPDDWWRHTMSEQWLKSYVMSFISSGLPRS